MTTINMASSAEMRLRLLPQWSFSPFLFSPLNNSLLPWRGLHILGIRWTRPPRLPKAILHLCDLLSRPLQCSPFPGQEPRSPDPGILLDLSPSFSARVARKGTSSVSSGAFNTVSATRQGMLEAPRVGTKGPAMRCLFSS